MCGIVGYIERSPNSELGERAYIALEMLQHRGQDACGVYFSDFKEGKIVKGTGYVDSVLNRDNIARIKGNMFIGQTRYPTTENKEEAQPLYTTDGDISLVFNGHVFNHKKIREKYREKGIYFHSNLDIESILTIFSESFTSNNDIPSAISNSIEKVIEEIRGGYAIIGTQGEKFLWVFRDPYGIRPLFYGIRKDDRAFASETIVLEKLGFEKIQEIAPGELVIIDKEVNEYRFQKKSFDKRFCSFEIVYFSRAVSMFKGRQIYKFRKHLGKKLAMIFENKNPEFDFSDVMVAPVPETSRAASDGFAEYLSNKFNRPFLCEVLEKHRYGGRNFIKPSEEIRRKEVFYTLTPILHNTKQKRIILIDDSIVRGTTSKRMIRTLRENGILEIHLCITFPPIRYSCFYGIDTPTRDELIAYNKTEEEVGKELGVDSLTYMTPRGLSEVLGQNLCIACVNGDYVNLWNLAPKEASASLKFKSKN